MVPYKENPRVYSEYFALYSAREKNIPAEDGGFWDQPAIYAEVMAEIDSAIADTMNNTEKTKYVNPEDDEKLAKLQAAGIPIKKK